MALSQFEPYMMSFLIGLLIGIERERSIPKGIKGMGVRTFILITLLGTIAAEIHEQTFTVLISGFVLTAILLNYYYSTVQQTHKTVGLTSSLAAAAAFCLGYLTPRGSTLPAVIGVAILIILLSREKLHQFAKEKLYPNEISAAATMVVIILCVMVFLPNHPVDPWQLFNPQRFGILIAIIAAMQFIGYIAIRLFGTQLGVLLLGFFGGLVSSTAVFATLPRFVSQHPRSIRAAVAAAVLATVGTLLELALVLLVASPQLMLAVLWPLLTIIVTGLVCAFVIFRNHAAAELIPAPKNPLDVKSVLYLSALIGGMLILVALARRLIGTEAVHAIAFFGGLFEIHSVSLATATLFASNKITLVDAQLTLYLAILASFVTKFVLLWSLIKNRFSVITSSILILMVSSGTIVAYLT